MAFPSTTGLIGLPIRVKYSNTIEEVISNEVTTVLAADIVTYEGENVTYNGEVVTHGNI